MNQHYANCRQILRNQLHVIIQANNVTQDTLYEVLSYQLQRNTNWLLGKYGLDFATEYHANGKDVKYGRRRKDKKNESLEWEKLITNTGKMLAC